FQNAGGHDGRDGIRGIVEAVHEIEYQREQHQQDQRRGDGAEVHQAFSSTTLSMTFATSWHLSVADSSASYTAFNLMSWRTSLSSRNNREIAARMTLSASDSSRSISW